MARPIEIDNLFVVFEARRRRVEALRGISLAVEAGEVFGFLGPNGAGKTTTLHVLLGFLTPTRGEARVFGEDVRRAIARRRLGYLPENPELYRFLTGRELLKMASRLFGLPGPLMRARIEELIRWVGLDEAADRRIATYSRGMRQRIGLAQALVNDPDLVILDEPTGGLDPLARMEVRRLIADLRDRGKTVFFSSHELSEVELVCDRIAILHRGRLVASGKIHELVPAGESLERYFLRVVREADAA